VENCTLLETWLAMANSWAYRISEAIIEAAPAADPVEGDIILSLGMTTADKTPMMTIAREISMRVIPDCRLRVAE